MCHSKYNEVDVHIKKNIQENVHILGDNRPVTSTYTIVERTYNESRRPLLTNSHGVYIYKSKTM